MAKLIILIGAPGAGKTTFAKGFEGKIVSTDSVRKSLYGGESIEYSEEQANFLIKENNISLDRLTKRQITKIKHELCVDYVFKIARKQCCEYLKNGENVIYDSVNFKTKYRKQILEEAQGLFSQCDVYYFDIPLRNLLLRNKSRARVEPKSVIRQIFKAIQAPQYKEGYDNIFRVTVDGNIILIEK